MLGQGGAVRLRQDHAAGPRRPGHEAASATSLTDIGGYLRPAGRSLGIVIDTPRLDTQRPFAEQADDVVEALEAALRPQAWWNKSSEVVRRWMQI